MEGALVGGLIKPARPHSCLVCSSWKRKKRKRKKVEIGQRELLLKCRMREESSLLARPLFLLSRIIENTNKPVPPFLGDFERAINWEPRSHQRSGPQVLRLNVLSFGTNYLEMRAALCSLQSTLSCVRNLSRAHLFAVEVPLGVGSDHA